MSSAIQVPGTFHFEKDSIKFVFSGGSRELDLSEVIQNEPTRRVLLAILGTGIAEKLSSFQELTEALKPQEKPDPKDIGMEAFREAERQMADAVKSAEARVKAIQEQVNEQSKSAFES